MDLKERVSRISEHRTQLEARLETIKRRQVEHEKQTQVKATLEEFSRKMRDVLENPSFETKQQILRFVVEKIVVEEDQITIKHMIPISDVGLRRYQLTLETPTRE